MLQGICDLVLHIFVEETSRSFIKKCWTPHQIFTCSFTGRQFISLNSVTPIWCRELKLVSAIFHQIFIFSLNDNPSKTEKYFLFHLQSSFCSRDIQFFVIFPLSKLCGFKRAKGSGIIYEVMNWLDIIFGITQKLLYITSSNCSVSQLRCPNKFPYYTEHVPLACSFSSSGCYLDANLRGESMAWNPLGKSIESCSFYIAKTSF